jgi:hypothetical protein
VAELPRLFTASATALAVVLILFVPARAAIQVQVTYTDGQILAGPLSFGLSELPASVTATILLQGSTTTSEFRPEDVIAFSLDFGDAHFAEDDLHSLSIVTGLTRETGDIAFTTLSYTLGGADGSPLASYAPLLAVAPNTASNPVSKSTPTVDGKLAANGNFALDLFGVDIASGEILHYHYRTSEQFGTLVSTPTPEPAAYIVWSLLGVTCGCGRRRWLRT